MKGFFASILTGGALLVLVFAAVTMFPGIAAPNADAMASAGGELEKARRLLEQYSENEERVAHLVAELGQLGVDNITLETDSLEGLMNNQPTVFAGLDEQLKAWFDPMNARGRREADAAFARLTGGAAPRSGAESFGGDPSRIQRAISEGRDLRKKVIGANARLLGEADAIVKKAFADAPEKSGPTAILAQRLKGMIDYQKGAAAQREAERLDRLGEPMRTRLSQLIEHGKLLAAPAESVKASGLDNVIAERTADLKKLESETSGLQKRSADVDAEIKQLETQLASARSESDRARATMEQMADQGVDLSTAAADSNFSSAYFQQSMVYRKALSDAHAAEFGTLQNARIDETYDLLKGQYIPPAAGQSIQPQRGLVAARAESESLAESIASRNAQMATLKSDLQVLNAQKTALERAASEAQSALQATQDQVRNHASQLAENRVAVMTLLDEAASNLADSNSAFENASKISLQWVNDANAALQKVENPEVKRRSAKDTIKDSRDMSAFAKSQSADALQRLGAVHLTRLRLAQRDLNLLDSVAQLPGLSDLGQADRESLQASVTSATESGTQALKDAYETWKGTGATLGNHWTVAALVATAIDTLSGYGDTGMIPAAVANYQAAIAGREEDPAVRPLAERAKQLQRQ